MSISQKQRVEKRLDKAKRVTGIISKRLLPSKRKLDVQRISKRLLPSKRKLDVQRRRG
jgi:hypothetical protein